MALAAADFEYVRTLVREHAAIVLEPSKGYLVESRLAPLVQQHGLTSIAALVGRLRVQRADALHAQVVEALTTNETSFYRDLHPFETLRQTLLPELVERRAASRQLSIWSAACSSGQEPYSLAMLLREHFSSLASWTVRITGTDLSAAMLSRAAEGLYSQLEVSRGLPATLLVKYFTREGLAWRLAPEVRRMVAFRPHNLAQPWPPSPQVDVLLLRNVLIYFDVPTKRAILQRARAALRPDGVLFLGGTETTLGVDDSFERCTVGRTTFYRPRT